MIPVSVTLQELRSLVEGWPMQALAVAVEAALRAARPRYPEQDIVPAARMVAYWLTDSEPLADGSPDWLPAGILEDIARRLQEGTH